MQRAVIYCRVSTEEEAQLNALENQIAEACKVVQQKGWILVARYIDEGKSGTTTKHRNAYKNLFADLETDQFDIVVVKSQDRLMRSPKDWYLFIDRLLTNKKRLFFYMENAFYSSDDGLLTGIKAILAEEYSRDLSKKINHAHKYRQRNKGTVLITSNTWGYDKVGKQVVVNEEEAEVVRLIYNLFAEGYGSYTISKMLAARGFYSRSGNPFLCSTLCKIVRNPLFKGTYVMNKRHFDFNTKKTEHMSEEEWIRFEGAVPPIVSEELWERANAQIDTKKKRYDANQTMKKLQGRAKKSHPLSTKIICGICGARYWHTQYRRNKGDLVVTWVCKTYVNEGKSKCGNVHVNNMQLEDTLRQIASDFYVHKDKLLQQAVAVLRLVLQPSDGQREKRLRKKAEQVAGRREKLLDAYLDGILDDATYKAKDVSLSEELENIQEELQKIEVEKLERSSVDGRLAYLEKEIRDLIETDLALDFLYRHLKSITVWPDRLLVEYDIFPPTTIQRVQINYHKVLLLPDKGKGN